MKKLKHPKGFVLTGTDNDGFRNRYSAIKNEQFKKIFVKFMSELDFDEKIIEKTFWSYDEESGDFELKISEFEDCCRYYKNDKYEVDVFYGNKKVIMVIRTKTRRPMLDNLEMKSRWIKVTKIKKIRERKNRNPIQTSGIGVR